MLIGYARTSTVLQDAGLEAQIRDLKAYGCEALYQEQVSSVGEREQLDAAIKSLRSDDKLVVTKCSIPDDHIDPRRSALFMARSLLSEVRDGDAIC
jgi:Tfp pilus assembly PilM family ATPase